MEGQQRTPLGVRIAERLMRRVHRRARLGLSAEFLARFGIADPWAVPGFDAFAGGGEDDPRVFLSIKPYLARLRRQAWIREHREQRLARLAERYGARSQSRAWTRWLGASSSGGRSRFLSALGVTSLSDMVLPTFAQPDALPAQGADVPARADRSQGAWVGARTSSSPWLITPFVPARVIRGGASAPDSGAMEITSPRQAALPRERALETAGHRLAEAVVAASPLTRAIQDAAPALSRTTRGRRLARELVELVDLPQAEQAVRVHRVLRRAGASRRLIADQVEQALPKVSVRASALAADRMGAVVAPRPVRGLRPLVLSSPSMQALSSVSMSPGLPDPIVADRPVAAAARRGHRDQVGRLAASPLRHGSVFAGRAALSASPVAKGRSRAAASGTSRRSTATAARIASARIASARNVGATGATRRSTGAVPGLAAAGPRRPAARAPADDGDGLSTGGEAPLATAGPSGLAHPDQNGSGSAIAPRSKLQRASARAAQRLALFASDSDELLSGSTMGGGGIAATASRRTQRTTTPSPQGLTVEDSTLLLPGISSQEANSVEGARVDSQGIAGTKAPSATRRSSPATVHAADRLEVVGTTRSGSILPLAVTAQASADVRRSTRSDAAVMETASVATTPRSVRFRPDLSSLLSGSAVEGPHGADRLDSSGTARPDSFRPRTVAPRTDPGGHRTDELGQATSLPALRRALVAGDSDAPVRAAAPASMSSLAPERPETRGATGPLTSAMMHASDRAAPVVPARAASIIPRAVTRQTVAPVAALDRDDAHGHRRGSMPHTLRAASWAAARLDTVDAASSPPRRSLVPPVVTPLAAGLAVVASGPERNGPGDESSSSPVRPAMAAASRLRRSPMVVEAARRVSGLEPPAPQAAAVSSAASSDSQIPRAARPGPPGRASWSHFGRSRPNPAVYAVRYGLGAPHQLVIERSQSRPGSDIAIASDGAAPVRHRGLSPLAVTDLRALAAAVSALEDRSLVPERLGMAGGSSPDLRARSTPAAAGVGGQVLGSEASVTRRRVDGTYVAGHGVSSVAPTRWASGRSGRPVLRRSSRAAAVARRQRGVFDTRGVYRLPHALDRRGAATRSGAQAPDLDLLRPTPASGRLGSETSTIQQTGPNQQTGPQQQRPGYFVDGGGAMAMQPGLPGAPRRAPSRLRPDLSVTLGAVDQGVSDGVLPTWAQRASGQPLIRREDPFITALARATDPEEIVRVIYQRAARGGMTAASTGLPEPVIQVIERIRTVAERVELGGSDSARGGPGSDAEIVRRSGVRGETPRSTVRRGAGMTSLRSGGSATRRSGLSASGVSKLSKKLQRLILLAERQRQAARQQVRMAEDSAAARAEGHASAGTSEGGNDKQIDIEALGREVLEVVSMELEMRKARSQEGSDEFGWW